MKETIETYNEYMDMAYLFLRNKGIKGFKVINISNIEGKTQEDNMTEGVEIYYEFADSPNHPCFTRVSYSDFEKFIDKINSGN